MKLDLSIAISTALLSALWVVLAALLQIPAWAGFLGCTSFFAINENSIKALLVCGFSLAAGAAWACMSLAAIHLKTGSLLILFISTGLIAFFMCIQARLKYVSFIPGAFIGSCTVFGNTNQIMPSLSALFIGLLAGFLMKYFGICLHKLTSSEKSSILNS
ncbi:TPA: DUF1097 domain-containing protein [Klebsiella pneumoniae]